MTRLMFEPIADQIPSGTHLLYDGAMGTGGMLTVAEETLAELTAARGTQVSTHLYGQEINAETYGIAKADLILKGKGQAADDVVGGPEWSTLSNDAYPSMEFDFMLSNPPYGKSWKTDLERIVDRSPERAEASDHHPGRHPRTRPPRTVKRIRRFVARVHSAHWEVSALRNHYSQVLDKMLDSSRITGSHSLPHLRNVDVQGGHINSHGLPQMDVTQHEYPRYTVAPGDLKVCEGGEVGRSAIWNGTELVAFQKALHRLRPRDQGRDAPGFLLRAMQTAVALHAFENGRISTIAHLTGEKLRAHRFAWPPVGEQRALVAYIHLQCGTADAAIDRARREINLLREFRTRLTSDVVTDQLDARHIAAALPDLDPAAEPVEVGTDEDDLDEATELLESLDA